MFWKRYPSESKLIGIYALLSLGFLTYLRNGLYAETLGLWSFVYLFYQRYLFMYGQLGMWVPEISAGISIFSPEYPFLDLGWLLALLIPSAGWNVNITTVIHMFLGMVGVFLLVRHITNTNLRAAFVAGLSYMTAGFFIISLGKMPFTNPLAWMPFAALFLIKALDNKQWLRNSAISALFVALMALGGGVSDYLWYLTIAFPLIIAMKVLFSGFRREYIIRAVGVFVVVFVLSASLAAVHLMPSKDYADNSGSRSGEQPYDTFIWQGGILNDPGFSFFPSLLWRNNLMRVGIVEIGIIIAGIALMAQRRRLNPYTAIGLLGSILLVLIASDTIIDRIIYQLPVINQLRDVRNALAIFPLFIAILLGVSYQHLTRIKQLRRPAITAAIVLIMLIEVAFIMRAPLTYDMEATIQNSATLAKVDELLEDDELVRVHRMTHSFVGSGLCPRTYTNPDLHLSDWCSGNAWYSNFVQFTRIAEGNNGYQPVQNVPPHFAKMRGILNDKYFLSDVNLEGKGINGANVSDVSLVGEFTDVEDARGFSPFIYENDRFLPRFYVADTAILLYGNPENSLGLMYSVLAQESYDPSSTIMVLSNNLPESELERFDLIILTDNSFQQLGATFARLQSQDPSRIFPSPAYPSNNVAEPLQNLTGSITPVQVDTYSPNKVVLALPENLDSGFLVMSEKYYLFEGWSVHAGDDQLLLYNTYDVISSAYFDNPSSRTIEISYLPRSLVTGAIISALALLVALVLIFLPSNIVSRVVKVLNKPPTPVEDHYG